LTAADTRTYGEVTRAAGCWRIVCEAQVLLRLRRVFERVSKCTHGVIELSDTPENARELRWFLERYPMRVDDAAYLARRAEEHRAQCELVFRLLSGGYTPPPFDALAVPAREYQRIAAGLTLTTGGLLLADDVGLGKTGAAICTFTDPRTLPVLVVTLTHLPQQWKRELAKFAPSLRVHLIAKGRPYVDGKPQDLARQIDRLFPLPDVIVINYAKLANWASFLAPLVKMVVYDEVQELRVKGSQKYSAALHLSSHASFRLGLSATPIINYGGEIYNVCEVLSPDGLGTRDEFIREWCTPKGNDKYALRDPQAFGSYMREQGLMLRRTRQDVGRELPALSRIPHFIDADLDQLDKEASDAVTLAQIILSQDGFGKGVKMRAGGELDYRLRRATGLAKARYVSEFVRLLIESGEPVLLYGWHHDVYDLWREQLQPFAPAFYTGEEDAKAKAEAERRFVSGETKLLIMSLRAGAGIDGLQKVCRTVVFGELDWSPGIHTQCAGRLHRDGQADPVMAYYLVSDHGSDPVIAGVLGVKKEQSDGVLDPTAPLVRELAADGAQIRRMAEEFLRQRGIALPRNAAA
jgi:SNF2 family DNA or RNA helicase